MATHADTAPEFTGWRQYLWPVHMHELKKLLPMLFMMCLFTFNYTLLRDMKDPLLLTAKGSGAEAIPFIKTWCVLPATFIFAFFYMRTSNKVAKTSLFYISLAPFLIFFGLFPTVIYPNVELLHPTTSADWLQAFLPRGLAGLVAIYRNWTFALFYVMAELWGTYGISVFFWGLANDVTRVQDAKRYYSVFGLGGNLSLLFSGALIEWVTDFQNSLPPGVDAWETSLKYLLGIITVAVLIIAGLYFYLQEYVLTDPRFAIATNEKKKKKPKANLSILDSLRLLASSRYIACITILVLAYGTAINLCEVSWKNALKLSYPDPNAYLKFMGRFSATLGPISALMMLFVGGNVMRIFGWRTAASLTPIVLTVTGSLFFAFLLFREPLTPIVSALHTTPLWMAVLIGAAQNIATKASKYSLFDPTKEMTYIPLDEDSKVKGKAVIDGIGGRLGKSAGALLQQFLLLLCGNLDAITGYLAVVCLLVGFVWLGAIHVLNKDFTALLEKQRVESEQAQS